MEPAPLVDSLFVIQELMKIVVWIMVGVFLMIAAGMVCFLILFWRSIKEL